MASLVTIFLLVVVIPPLLALPDTAFLNRVNDGFPAVAGAHFLHGDADPYPALVGLLIVAAWAAVTLLAGWRVLRRRDA